MWKQKFEGLEKDQEDLLFVLAKTEMDNNELKKKMGLHVPAVEEDGDKKGDEDSLL